MSWVRAPVDPPSKVPQLVWGVLLGKITGRENPVIRYTGYINEEHAMVRPYGVMIGSEDSKTLGEFYTKVFGDPMYQQGDWYGFGDESSSLMIGSHSEVHGKNADAPRLIISVQTDDVRKEFDRIKALGAEVVAEPYLPDEKGSPNIWLATLADPDGNYLQLATPWDGEMN